MDAELSIYSAGPCRWIVAGHYLHFVFLLKAKQTSYIFLHRSHKSQCFFFLSFPYPAGRRTLVRLVNTWPRSWFQDGGKISEGDREGRVTAHKFSRQCKAFMDGKDRLILCSPLIAMGFLLRHVLCFIWVVISVTDRGFKCPPKFRPRFIVCSLEWNAERSTGHSYSWRIRSLLSFDHSGHATYEYT